MGMTGISCPRILYIDAYDSFSNNIVALLETKLGVSITVIKVDTLLDDIEAFISPFSAVILGPGPGTPHNPKDVGLYNKLWNLSEEKVIPVLGICLGFQSLVFAFGGAIKQLHQPRHGIVRNIKHGSDGIFASLTSPLEAVQYHSLHASLAAEPALGDLIPLAWDVEKDNPATAGSEYIHNPDAILMAVRHKTRPYYGIQFHPESICSSDEAQQIILNWWQQSAAWREAHPITKDSIVSNPDAGNTANPRDEIARITGGVQSIETTQSQDMMTTRVLPLSNLTIPTVCSVLGLTNSECVVLDSENHQRAELGRFSIIGLVTPGSLRFEYNAGSGYFRQIKDGKTTKIDLINDHGGDVLAFLRSFMQERSVCGKHKEIPFWGGLVGCIGYEACLEKIGIRSEADHQNEKSSDFSFVFVERSIVISHMTQKLYIQSMFPSDTWPNDAAFVLTNTPPPSPSLEASLRLDAQISTPDEAAYKSAIRKCRSYIGQGESYELCLTNQTTVTTTKQNNPWALYSRLRRINPAPFAAYMRIGDLTLLSSSPERFLSWTRPTMNTDNGSEESTCQFRPIKGTIKRQPDPSQPPLTLAQAEQQLATPKEKAENLMIVDLIRHDVHGVAGAGNVSVPKLMVVEEYETLFQLVSVIEGTVRAKPVDRIDNAALTGREGGKTGIDVLAASLPPGSMTGAPKLRSCQLLKSLEEKPRGIYSGVVGYLDVGGGGDFSVVIRSALHWDDGQGSERDTWSIGAGGAITTLSTEQGEYEEMMAKLKSTLRLFDDM